MIADCARARKSIGPKSEVVPVIAIWRPPKGRVKSTPAGLKLPRRDGTANTLALRFGRSLLVQVAVPDRRKRTHPAWPQGWPSRANPSVRTHVERERPPSRRQRRGVAAQAGCGPRRSTAAVAALAGRRSGGVLARILAPEEYLRRTADPQHRATIDRRRRNSWRLRCR